MKKTVNIWLFPAAAALVLSGCADPNSTYGANQHKVIAATTGAVIGGVIGHQMDDDAGRYVGAAAGALVGGVLGNQMDNVQNQTAAYQQQTLQQQQRAQQYQQQYQQQYNQYNQYNRQYPQTQYPQYNNPNTTYRR